MSHLRLIAGNTATILVLTLLLKPLSVVRDMMVAKYFGVSSSLGIYFLLFGVASFFTSMVHSAYQGTITPIYIRLYREGKADKAMTLVATTGVAYFLVVSIICAMILLLNSKLVAAFAPGMTAQQIAEAVKYLPWVLLIIFSVSGVHFFASVLEAEQRFLLTRPLQGVVPLAVIAGVYFFNWRGWSVLFPSLAIGNTLIAIALAIAFLWLKRKFSWKLDFSDPEIRAVIRRWPPMMGGAIVSGSTLIVDRIMTSLLGTQQLATFGYVETLYTNLNGLIIGSLSAAVLPVFSNIFAENKKKLADALFNTFCYMVALLLPVIIFVALFGQTIVEILYERGSFHAHDRVAVAKVLGVLVFDLLPFAGIVLCARTLHVLTDVRVTFYAGLLQAGLNVVLDYFFMIRFGLMGIAMATFAVNTLMFAFFGVVLARKHAILPSFSHFTRIFWIILSAVLVSISTYAYKPLGTIASVAVFIITYLLVMFVFPIAEYRDFWQTGFGWVKKGVTLAASSSSGVRRFRR